MSENIEINESEARMSQLEVFDDTDNEQTDDDCDSDQEVEYFKQLFDYNDETDKNSTHRAFTPLIKPLHNYSDFAKQYQNIYSQEIYEFMNWVFYTNDLNLIQIKSESSQSFYTALNHFYKLQENEPHDKHLEMEMLDNSASVSSTLPLSNNGLLEDIKHLNLLYRRYGTTKQSDVRNRICGLFANAHSIDELKCDIQLLSDTNDEYKIIHRYVTNAGQNYFVKHIFRIKRQTEEQRFKQFVDCKRMLLFHGTPIYNCYGILMNGLKTGVGNLDGTGLPQGFCCNLYKGNQSRDASDVTTIDNAVVPYGTSIQVTHENPAPIPIDKYLAILLRQRMLHRKTYGYQYNEYLVARPEQVKLKYLVVFRKSEES